MAEFGEELLRQRVWDWLERDKGMTVDAEMELGTGRIDLVAETDTGELWGIEVKTGAYRTEQLHRYVESGKLDRLFIASAAELDTTDTTSFDVNELSQVRKRMAGAINAGHYTEEEARSAIEQALPDEILSQKIGSQTVLDYVTLFLSSKGPIPLDEAVQRISRAVSFPEVGVIHVPDVEPYDLLGATDAPTPEITHDGAPLESAGGVTFARREEPWIRHSIWQLLGGIPEGHIPNTLSSDQPYRPIDLIAFEGSRNPTDALEHPEENKIIGVEAKGEGSFSPTSVHEQLTQFLQTETVSQLYLAVPASLEERATELVEGNSDLADVGIILVTEDGHSEICRTPTDRVPAYDGYMETHQQRKTGYGDRFPSEIGEVVSPYITEEEADRLKYSDPIAYAQDVLTENPWQVPDTLDAQAETREPLSELTEEVEKSGSRIYVLEGSVASQHEMETGYVELLVDYYRETDTLLFNFGRNYGGYIWFTGEEIDNLLANLTPIQDLESVMVPGQGFVKTSLYDDYTRIEISLRGPDPDIEWIDNNVLPETDVAAESVADLDFPTSAKPRPSYATHHEKRLSLEIVSNGTDLEGVSPDAQIGSFRLGSETEGADVAFTYAQWCNLIASIHVLRERGGKTRELPGKETNSWTQSRIAPSGQLVEDTDDIDYRNDVFR
jgi:Holliday junction resolvase-like predicted endonuclease